MKTYHMTTIEWLDNMGVSAHLVVAFIIQGNLCFFMSLIMS